MFKSKYPGAGRPSKPSHSHSHSHNPHHNQYNANNPPPSYTTYQQTPAPPLSNLSAWFDHYDRDRSGSLNKEEVVSALAETIPGALHDPNQRQAIRESVYNIWVAFDSDGSGTIDRREFCGRGGLGESILAMVQQMNQEHRQSAPVHHPQPSAPPPTAPTWGSAASSTSTGPSPPPAYAHHATTSAPASIPTVQAAVYNPPTQPKYETVRVGIPKGVSPGQKLSVPAPGGSGEMVMVPIPDRSQWMYNASMGQHTFDVQLPIQQKNAPVVVAGTVVGQTQPHSHTTAYSNTHSQTHSHYNTQPQSNAYNAGAMTTWQNYSHYSPTPYHDPPLGMQRAHHYIPLTSTPSSHIATSGRRRALIIGINYKGTRAQLRGCVNDAHNMKNILLRQGYPDDGSHMVMLTDEHKRGNYAPTGANILKAMQWLTQGVSQGDVLFFHFSGHGAQVPDKSGLEADGLNETILPLDYKKRQITDDELWGRLVYPLPHGVRLTALMDCCHSGTGLDLPFEYRYKSVGTAGGGYGGGGYGGGGYRGGGERGGVDQLLGKAQKYGAKYGVSESMMNKASSMIQSKIGGSHSHGSGSHAYDQSSNYQAQAPYPTSTQHTPIQTQWMEDINPAHSQGDVVLFSGCKDSQTSADVQDRYRGAGGAMTQAFISTFQDHPHSTYADFLSQIHATLKKGRFSQRPQLTSSQQFDTRSRVFSFTEGIEGNHNAEIGRMKRRHVKPGKVGGGQKFGDIDDLLFGAGAAVLAGAVLGELF